MSLLDAMNTACEDIIADYCRGSQLDVFFSGAWQGKKFRCDVTVMKNFALTNKSNRMSTKNIFFMDVIL